MHEEKKEIFSHLNDFKGRMGRFDNAKWSEAARGSMDPGN